MAVQINVRVQAASLNVRQGAKAVDVVPTAQRRVTSKIISQRRVQVRLSRAVAV